MTARLFDLSLLRLWPQEPVQETGWAHCSGLAPERKARARTVRLPALLNNMTLELAAQFDDFARLRARAATIIDAEGEGDDAALKIAKADMKAATDSVSLIIRTLEKIEILQRGLADERERADSATLSEEEYRAAKRRLESIIEARAKEQAARLIQNGWEKEV